MTNYQLPIRRDCPVSAQRRLCCATRPLHWSLVIGNWSLRLAVLALLAVLAACGDDAPKGPLIPDFDADEQQPQKPVATPAVELSAAPTDAHRELAKLLPSAELDDDSLRYGGWDSAAAAFSSEEPKQAAMPVVQARYSKTGFNEEPVVEGQRAKRHELRQTCDLYIIRAPEQRAAAVIERDIKARLVDRGFELSAPRAMPVGMADGEVIDVEAACYVRIDEGADEDEVLTGYVLTAGDVVFYALDRHKQPVMKNEDGTRIAELSGRRGPHYGAQQILQAYTRMGG